MQWEYLILTRTTAIERDELNRLGAEGWELVAVTAFEHFGGNLKSKRVEFNCVFKRAKPS